jgi:hypothetical protein
MKKLFLILAILIFAAPVMAQTWHTANQVTLTWDAVPKVATTDSANKYQVYIKFQSTTAAPVLVGSEIEATQQAVSFSAEGRYYLCVDAARYPQGETQPVRSEIACSHDAASTADGTPFGVKYFIHPTKPGKLRVGN